MPNLVGIGNSQVPTNAMLGGLAYQDSVGEINIDKIKARTSDTAKDIFVYDTRKDSDGGAWRHRTQNTSWYNEGASATRGARKEFPAVAIIVVEVHQVTIYDADNPNCPMWMVFNQSTIQLGAMVGYSNMTIGCCTMLNGILMVGLDHTTQPNVAGLRLINFISEHHHWKANITGRHSSQHWPIVERNGGRVNVNIDSNLIVNEVINDVDATVLPNAPIDASTGLPTPTIAVATDGGVSVIKDDGTVVDILGQGYNPTDNKIDFDHINKLIFIESGGFPQRQSIPSADIDRQNASGRDRVYAGTSSSVPAILGTATNIVPDFHGFVCGSTTGLTILDYDTSQSQEMVAYAAASYNTGYMVGDIKGAFLSSTDDTNLTDTNLVTNGDFSNGSTGWNLHGLTVNTSGNNMVLTSTSGNQRISQAITVEPGQTYYFTLTSSGNSNRYVSTNTVSSGSLTNQENSFFTVPAGTTTVHVVLYVIGTGNSATFDDVIVTKADPDRSVNNQPTNNGGQGLRVFGTVTKSAVATGAELVAYSGFTSSNYLEMPSGDLGSNTSTNGPLTVMCWFKGSTNGSNEQSLVMIGPASQYQARGILLDGSGNLGWFRWNNDPLSSRSVTDNHWHHCVGTLDSSSTVKLYVDGELVYNQSVTLNTSSSTQVRIGYSTGNNAPLANGSIALVRISNSVASSEQIKKMYNDEKCLYHENAKCTLHGTSDAVTGLAFDNTNNVLHVGTSSGRSEFRGLNRINNTTTAVTTAISASDELVAEQ